MLNRRKIIFALICIMMIQTTSAVLISGEVLKKDDITVVILGDVHTDTSSFKSRAQSEDLLEISKKNNAYLIVEDYLSYAGSDPILKNILDPLQNISYPFIKTKILTGLCNKCIQENVASASSECRYSLCLGYDLEEQFGPGYSIKKQIEENLRTIESLKQCSNNPVFQQFLNDAIQKHDFYKKQKETKQTLNVFYDLDSVQMSDKLLELNTVCQLLKALEEKQHTLFIIGVGAAHIRPISELIQKILQFNVILRKHPINEVMLHLLGSPEKNIEMRNKIIHILNEHALYLPQFFDEALKAQPIRSRL